MRRELEHDDRLEEEPPSRDLVLGMPALLGIFFALALLGAICFGWGYRSGHGGHGASTIASAPVPTKAPGASRGALTHPIPLGGSGPATEDDEPEQVPDTSGKPLPGASVASIPLRESPAPAGVEPTPAEHEAAGFPPNYVVPDAARPPVAAVPQRAGIHTEGGALMVQIAAVSRAADAETLASALRHDGFPAVVRTSTTDNFFHIQVGPFATLDGAKAMRTRLADNGYNAFIKP